MRIAEIVDSLALGGAERMLVDLSIALDRRGHRVSVFCLRQGGPLASVLADAGIEVIALGKPPGLHFPTAVRFARLLKQMRPDVVHTHNPLVHHYGVLGGRAAGARAIVNTLHGLTNLDTAKTRLVYEASCAYGQHVVAVCPAVQAHLKQRTVISRQSTSVICNGIPLEPFLEIPPAHSNGSFVFGTVGRLAPVKDHDTLLRAFALLREPRARLEILGDGPLAGVLQKTAHELGIAGRVQFHGAAIHPAGFLARIDAFVLSSRSEGLPLTLIEAMAAARPVVATGVGGVPDLVLASGCGLLAPPSHPDKLAGAMRAIMRDVPSSVGQLGRDHVSRHYRVAGMASQYEQLFTNLLAQ